MPFIIKNEENKLLLNEKLIEIIENSTDPQFYLFYGKTRIGKSTTLNQLIRGNQETRKYKNKQPFDAIDSLDSVTKGCNIYGPIKASELLRRHGINKMKNFNDFDIFFCDTEGISSLDGIQKESIPGILTLLQLCTMSVFMVYKFCDVNNLKEICSQIQISRCLKLINENNNDNKEKEFPTPKISVYISDIFLNLDENEEDEEEEEENKDLDFMKNKYNESGESEKERIFNVIKEKYPNLNIEKEDFDVIPGGPYDNNCIKEPEPNDINADLYWWSINTLMEKFLYIKRRKMNSKEIINMIKFLFDIFQGVESLNDDFNLEEFLKKYLTQKFENYSKIKFDEIINEMKNDIKSNFLKYLNIINDLNEAKNSLNECFDENFDLYKRLIKDKVESFIDLHIELYQKHIKEQIDNEFKSICDEILLDENINILINDVVDMINEAEFKEDIDMNKIKNLETFWNLMYEKNKIILDYFKDKKADLLNNLKQNFLFKINTKFQNLLKTKIEWSNYLKNIIINFKDEINEIYNETFSKCNYQEDFEIYIKKPEILFNDLFPTFIEKYFENISNKRENEIIEKMYEIINKEYENIKKNKLPIWKNIKSDLILRIDEVFKLYLFKIFNKKKYRDEINQNLGRKENFYNVIPSDIKENNLIKKEKKKEINEIIEKKIEDAEKEFIKLRNNLPLFKEFLENIINQCTKLIDNKIKELLKKFDYIEEKILFDSDKIFTFLSKNENIYKNSGNKLNEINIKLRELCNKKANEYENLIKKNKPEWNKIKSEKNKIINKKCVDFINETFENAEFQDNINSVNYEKLKQSIFDTSELFKEVSSKKKNEIYNLIDENVQKTMEKINSNKIILPKWETIKFEKIQKAYIEMNNKAKTELNSLDINKVTNILIEYVKKIPYFFDFNDNGKKKELLNELSIIANSIGEDYIQRKKEEEKKNNELIKKIMEEEKRLEMERKKLEEEKRRIEEENRRIEEERRRIEEQRRMEEQRINAERNRIEDLARRTLRGEFGNGQARRNNLGNDYAAVQNRVNEILGIAKRH